MIIFNCHRCGKRIRVAPDLAGHKGRCPSCKQIVVVPQQDSKAYLQDPGMDLKLDPLSSREVSQPEPNLQQLTIYCPACAHRIRITDSGVGSNIQCPSCKKVFTGFRPQSELWCGYPGSCVLVRIAVSMWERSLAWLETDAPTHLLTLLPDRYSLSRFRRKMKGLRIVSYAEILKTNIKEIHRKTLRAKNPTYFISLKNGVFFTLYMTQAMQSFGLIGRKGKKLIGKPLGDIKKPVADDPFTIQAARLFTDLDIYQQFIDEMELNLD